MCVKRKYDLFKRKFNFLFSHSFFKHGALDNVSNLFHREMIFLYIKIMTHK